MHLLYFLGNVDALKLIYNKNKKVLQLVAKDCKQQHYIATLSSYVNNLLNIQCSYYYRFISVTTPIFFAAQEGHFTTLQYLHQKGKCDLGSRSHDGMSPIHAASQNGHLEIIQVNTTGN